jgi:hypothetical protein
VAGLSGLQLCLMTEKAKTGQVEENDDGVETGVSQLSL